MDYEGSTIRVHDNRIQLFVPSTEFGAEVYFQGTDGEIINVASIEGDTTGWIDIGHVVLGLREPGDETFGVLGLNTLRSTPWAG